MKLNFVLKIVDSKEARSTKTFGRNPICMLCLESKDIRHVVKMLVKLEVIWRDALRLTIHSRHLKYIQFMLIYTHNFWVFFGSCDRPMPFSALLIILGKSPGNEVAQTASSVLDKSKQTVRCSLKHLIYFEAALQFLSIFALHKMCHSRSGFAGLGYT